MTTVSAESGGSGFAFSIPDGAHAGDIATMDWFFQHPHSGWVFLENVSGGPSPSYTTSGPGAGTPAPHPDQGPSDFVGSSGETLLHLQDTLFVGQTYRIKTYLNDGSYGTANETTFVAQAGSGGAAAPAVAAAVGAPAPATSAAPAQTTAGPVASGAGGPAAGGWFSQSTAGIPNWVLALGAAVVAAEML